MLYQTQNPHGGDIYSRRIGLDFSANTNPFGTPQSVLDAVSAALPDLHRYPDPFCRRLTEAIARHEQVPGSYILCGNGAADLIYSWCVSLRPKTALMPAPTFSEYALALEQAGCHTEYVFLDPQKDFALEESFLVQIQASEPDAVFLCSPNNPTGKTIAPGLLRQIADLCEEKQIFLFLDECFQDLTDRPSSLKPLLSGHPHLLLLKAFTKSYGMAGLRLGYCLSSNEQLLRSMSRSTQPWNISSLAQAAGIAALQEDTFLEQTRALLRSERPCLKQELEKLGFHVCESEANYLLFSAPPHLHRKLEEQGIAIRNCSNYPGLSAGWYRTAVRLPAENRCLIETIKQVL